MMQSLMRGPALAAVMLLALSGCVSLPKTQAYNREAHASIKTIAVLETVDTRPTVFMMNHPGMNFGLIGGLVAATDQANMARQLNANFDLQDFRPLTYFRERLNARMEERGYTLIWPSSQVEAGKVTRGSFSLRKAYQPVQADAQMDINFGFLGYAAGGAGNDSPYRPTVTMAVRLVSPDGTQNYFTDYFVYNNVFGMTEAVAINPDQQYSYPRFDDLRAAGPQSVEGMKQAIDTVAGEIARQL